MSLYKVLVTDQNNPKSRFYSTIFQGVLFFTIGILISVFGYFIFRWYSIDLISAIFLVIAMTIYLRRIFLNELLQQNRILKIDMVQSIQGIVNISIAYLIGLTLIRLTSWRETFEHPAIFTGVLYLSTFLHTPIRVSQTITDSVLPTSLLPSWEKHYIERIFQIKQNILTTTDSSTALILANRTIKDITRDARAGELLQMIENEINHIFRHKALEHDQFLGHSRLFELKTLQKEVEQYKKGNGISQEGLSDSQLLRCCEIF